MALGAEPDLRYFSADRSRLWQLYQSGLFYYSGLFAFGNGISYPFLMKFFSEAVKFTAQLYDFMGYSTELMTLRLSIRGVENVSLTARHEELFDLDTVKEAAEAAGMSKPSSSQIYYVDLSDGDSAVVYQQEEPGILSRLLTSLNHGIYAVVEYFD